MASGSATIPSFFKVMLDDSSKDLRIPPAFVKHFDGVVPHKSQMIRSSDGKIWSVYVQKIDRCFFFRKGWREFVEDNFIESGDFLVFHYVGYSKFEVVIYGKHCCEKDNRDSGKGSMDRKRSSKEAGDEIQDTDSDGSSDADELDTKEGRRHQGNQKKSKRSKLKEVVEEKTTPCLGRLPHKFKARPLKSAIKFVSNYPFFRVVMQPSYLARALRIPKEFSSTLIKGSTRQAKLLAYDRFWGVKLMVHRDWSGLGGGWKRFVEDNALQVGDVCVFEMLESDELVFKVSLFKCGLSASD